MAMLPALTLMVATFAHVSRGTLEMDLIVNVRFYQFHKFYNLKWLVFFNFNKRFHLSAAIRHCGVSDDCDTNAQCIETNDGFVCRCVRGFEGDGVNCCELMRTF